MREIFNSCRNVHPHLHLLLERVDQMLDRFAGSQVELREMPAFLMYDFRNDDAGVCPFSIWIERGDHGSIFFMAGNPAAQATVLHYWDLSLETIFTDAMATLDDLLCGPVQEKRVYCQDKLRKVSYITTGTEYTFQAGNVFMCLEKRVETVQHIAWAEPGYYTSIDIHYDHDDHHHGH